MISILHDLKDPKLWELWHIPCCGLCRIYIINYKIPRLECTKGFYNGVPFQGRQGLGVWAEVYGWRSVFRASYGVGGSCKRPS